MCRATVAPGAVNALAALLDRMAAGLAERAGTARESVTIRLRAGRGGNVGKLKQGKIRYVPLDEATSPPDTGGFYEVLVQQWWACQPGKGLIFYGPSPQCNKDESISRKIQEMNYPEAETIFVHRVYVRHDCGDYV